MLAQFVPAVNPRAEIAARKAERARVSAQKVISWYRDPANQPAAPRVAIQYNNSKIKDTETTAFLIFSLPAVMTCPGANTGCLSACYARRDERFPSVRAYRLANLILSRPRHNRANPPALSGAGARWKPPAKMSLLPPFCGFKCPFCGL